MAPKDSNAGTKRKHGDLKSWLQAPTSTTKRSQLAKSTDEMESNKQMAKGPKPDPDPGSTNDNNAGPTSKVVPTSARSEHNSPTLTLTNHTGDIFSAPRNTLLIHACNCQGSWSAGIALAFKQHYPAAFKVYAAHCKAHADDASSLLGKALLIPPAAATGQAEVARKGTVGAPRIGAAAAPQRKGAGATPAKGERRHFVACLFTSTFYGRRRDAPAKILGATGPAMRDLLAQVREWNAGCGDDGERVEGVRMCKINSGLFAVRWEDTVEVLEGIGVGEGGVGEAEVWEREEG